MISDSLRINRAGDLTLHGARYTLGLMNYNIEMAIKCGEWRVAHTLSDDKKLINRDLRLRTSQRRALFPPVSTKRLIKTHK